MEPLFFSQTRVGRNEKPICVRKIRTMYSWWSPRINGEKDPKDPRIIPTRKWLRRFWFDEIPQIINIILGEMNIFGPRPYLNEEYENLDHSRKERYKRVNPGLLGMHALFDLKLTHGNSIKARDALCRLMFLKRNDSWLQQLKFRIWIIKKTIEQIRKWKIY